MPILIALPLSSRQVRQIVVAWEIDDEPVPSQLLFDQHPDVDYWAPAQLSMNDQETLKPTNECPRRPIHSHSENSTVCCV